MKRKKNLRNSPPRDPVEAYVYRKRKKVPVPDWIDVGEAFEAGMRYADRRYRKR